MRNELAAWRRKAVEFRDAAATTAEVERARLFPVLAAQCEARAAEIERAETGRARATPRD
jgi:hypothetical protein